MEYSFLLILIALVQYQWFALQAGLARNKYGVKAPATTGNADWERIYRVQMNTLEQLVIFVPAALLFAWLVSPVWVWIPGGLWLVGRQLYAIGYTKAAEKRGVGMGVGFLGNVILLLGSFAGAVMRIVG